MDILNLGFRKPISRKDKEKITYTANGAIFKAKVLERQKPAPPVANQNDEFLPSLDLIFNGEAVEVFPRYQGFLESYLKQIV